MYGLVNLAIKDMVITKFGEDRWNSICDEAKSPTRDFVDMQYYPDSVTYSLVGAASKQLGIPAEGILREFGKYWVLYTAKFGYGPLMDLFGENLRSCLMNLNNLHARMGLSLPNLEPPRFEFEEISANEFRVRYFSKRAGLSPMVQGLLEGLALRYNTIALIHEIPGADEFKTFRILLAE